MASTQIEFPDLYEDFRAISKKSFEPSIAGYLGRIAVLQGLKDARRVSGPSADQVAKRQQFVSHASPLVEIAEELIDSLSTGSWVDELKQVSQKARDSLLADLTEFKNLDGAAVRHAHLCLIIEYPERHFELAGMASTIVHYNLDHWLDILAKFSASDRSILTISESVQLATRFSRAGDQDSASRIYRMLERLSEQSASLEMREVIDSKLLAEMTKYST
jgi:hypothetical protein